MSVPSPLEPTGDSTQRLSITAEREWSAHPRSDAAYRPGAPPLNCPSNFGDCDLLFPGGQVCSRRVTQSTVPLPRALVELHTPIETVAGVDRPIAAGLAGAQRVPGRAVAHRRHLGARFGTDPQHRGPRGCHDLVLDGAPPGFDTV